jgi:hypothetical protein
VTSLRSASTLIAQARDALAGSATERLGAPAVHRTVFGIGRAPRIVPVAEAWHLGVLLIGAEGVWGTGIVVRAREEAIRGFTAASQRERADLAAAARRGGFREGEPCHLDWTPIDLDAVDAGSSSGPLVMVAGQPQVRWSAAGSLRPLDAYLREHLELR